MGDTYRINGSTNSVTVSTVAGEPVQMMTNFTADLSGNMLSSQIVFTFTIDEGETLTMSAAVNHVTFSGGNTLTCASGTTEAEMISAFHNMRFVSSSVGTHVIQVTDGEANWSSPASITINVTEADVCELTVDDVSTDVDMPVQMLEIDAESFSLHDENYSLTMTYTPYREGDHIDFPYGYDNTTQSVSFGEGGAMFSVTFEDVEPETILSYLLGISFHGTLEGVRTFAVSLQGDVVPICLDQNVVVTVAAVPPEVITRTRTVYVNRTPVGGSGEPSSSPSYPSSSPSPSPSSSDELETIKREKMNWMIGGITMSVVSFVLLCVLIALLK